MQETSAQTYGRALEVWSQWLRQWRHTRDLRALQAALTCREIAAEKLTIWHAELRVSQSAMQAERTERTRSVVTGLRQDPAPDPAGRAGAACDTGGGV